MDTIFALATARGRSGVAIVRISGPEAFAVAKKLAGSLPGDRGLRQLRDARGDVIEARINGIGTVRAAFAAD